MSYHFKTKLPNGDTVVCETFCPPKEGDEFSWDGKTGRIAGITFVGRTEEEDPYWRYTVWPVIAVRWDI